MAPKVNFLSTIDKDTSNGNSILDILDHLMPSHLRFDSTVAITVPYLYIWDRNWEFTASEQRLCVYDISYIAFKIFLNLTLLTILTWQNLFSQIIHFPLIIQDI
jgi:hypothetical protein